MSSIKFLLLVICRVVTVFLPDPYDNLPSKGLHKVGRKDVTNQDGILDFHFSYKAHFVINWFCKTSIANCFFLFSFFGTYTNNLYRIHRSPCCIVVSSR